MPIYEYKCNLCQQSFDLLQKVNDAPKVECPNCGKDGLKKIVSATTFHLKGTGWYATDFKNSGTKEIKTTTTTTTPPTTTTTGE